MDETKLMERPARDDSKYLLIPDRYTKEQAEMRFKQVFGKPPEVVHHFDGYWWPGPCPERVTA